MSNEIPIVFDIGFSNSKIGYGGDNRPKIVTPSRYSIDEMAGEIYFSEYLLENKQLAQKNFSQNDKNFGDVLQELYNSEILNKLSLKGEDHPLVISEESNNNKTLREAVVSLVEKSKIPKIYLVKKSALTLYSCGKTSGAVLESGGGATKLTPVEEGYIHEIANKRGKYGGDTLTGAIASCLTHKSCFKLGENIDDFSNGFLDYKRFLLAEEIKVKCFGLIDDMDASEQVFNLPDGSKFQFSQDLNNLGRSLFSENQMYTSVIIRVLLLSFQRKIKEIFFSFFYKISLKFHSNDNLVAWLQQVE